MAKNPDLMRRLMTAYRELLAYLFDNPEATRLYAQQVRISESLVAGAVEKFQLKKGKQLDKITGLNAIMDDGVQFKFLDKPLSPEQINNLIQILPPG